MHTDTNTDTQTHTHTDRQTDRQTDRHTHTHTHTHTHPAVSRIKQVQLPVCVCTPALPARVCQRQHEHVPVAAGVLRVCRCDKAGARQHVVCATPVRCRVQRQRHTAHPHVQRCIRCCVHNGRQPTNADVTGGQGTHQHQRHHDCQGAAEAAARPCAGQSNRSHDIHALGCLSLVPPLARVSEMVSERDGECVCVCE